MNKEAARAAAEIFMKDKKLTSRYIMDSPFIYEEGEDFCIEFQDKNRDCEPGVCIIAVDKKTGIPRIEPVE